MLLKSENKTNKYVIIKNILGMLIGLFSIIQSIIVGTKTISDFTLSYTSRNTYGGDAYTGIQNAAADAANNAANAANKIAYAAKCMRSGFMAILLVAGLVLICFCLFNILEAKASANQSELTPASSNAAINEAATPENTVSNQESIYSDTNILPTAYINNVSVPDEKTE